MGLSANTPRAFDPAVDAIRSDVPLGAAIHAYEGDFMAVSSATATAGYARPFATGDTEFLGVSDYDVDNAAGSNGTLNAKIRAQGVLKNVAVTGATAATHINDTVYATTSGTLTLSSTGNLAVGKVLRWISSGVCDVFFQGAAARSI